jgi:zinc transporter ZupT
MTGHGVLEFIQRGDWARTPAVPPRLMLGVAMVAAATVAGGWLAGRRRGHPEIWFAAAAGALLVIAGMHVLPDAWVDAGAARIWPGLVALTAVGAFIATGLFARAGCGCHQHEERASGTATALALAIHRSLEGSAIVWPDPRRSPSHWVCTHSPKAWPQRHCSAASRAVWPAGWP